MTSELPREDRAIPAVGEIGHERFRDIVGSYWTPGAAHEVCRATGGRRGIPEGGSTAARGREALPGSQPGLGEHVKVTSDGVGVSADPRRHGCDVDGPCPSHEFAEDLQPDADERRHGRQWVRPERVSTLSHMT